MTDNKCSVSLCPHPLSAATHMQTRHGNNDMSYTDSATSRAGRGRFVGHSQNAFASLLNLSHVGAGFRLFRLSSVPPFQLSLGRCFLSLTCLTCLAQRAGSRAARKPAELPLVVGHMSKDFIFCPASAGFWLR